MNAPSESLKDGLKIQSIRRFVRFGRHDSSGSISFLQINVTWIMVVFEVSLVATAVFVMLADRQGGGAVQDTLRWFLAILIPFSMLVLFCGSGLYEKSCLRRRGSPPLLRIARVWLYALGSSLLIAMSLVMVAGYGGALSPPEHRIATDAECLPLLYVVGLIGLLLSRTALPLLMPPHGPSRRVLVVGATAAAAHFIQGATRDTANAGRPDVEIIGLVEEAGRLNGGTYQDVPVLGSFDLLPDLARAGAIDAIVVAVPPEAAERVHKVLACIEVDNLEVHMAIEPISKHLNPEHCVRLGEAVTLKFRTLGLPAHQAVVKRLLDIVLSLVLLIATSPLLLACAIAVKLGSPGPVLFRQTRTGYRGRSFQMLKFRSFYHDQADPAASQQTGRNDPRVSPVGAFLRKHSLDELPQLSNVLLGHMSLVGPRPHAARMTLHGQNLEAVFHGYQARHRVKPGMTGLAQIKGWRGNLDSVAKLEGRLEHDLEYIRKWSLMLDLRIIIRTGLCVFRDSNAF